MASLFPPTTEELRKGEVYICKSAPWNEGGIGLHNSIRDLGSTSRCCLLSIPKEYSGRKPRSHGMENCNKLLMMHIWRLHIHNFLKLLYLSFFQCIGHPMHFFLIVHSKQIIVNTYIFYTHPHRRGVEHAHIQHLHVERIWQASTNYTI